MDAPNPRRPWSLGSGAPCRNDGEILNSTALGWEGGDQKAAKPLILLAPTLTLPRWGREP